MAKPVKRRKPADKRKAVFLRVRITEEQQGLFTQAATYDGLSLSGWATSRLLRAARSEIAEKRKKEGSPMTP